MQVTRIPVSWLGSRQISLFLKRMTICTKISLKNLFGRRRRGSGSFVTGNLPLAVCCSFIHLPVNDSTCAHSSQSLKVQRIGMISRGSMVSFIPPTRLPVLHVVYWKNMENGTNVSKRLAKIR